MQDIDEIFSAWSADPSPQNLSGVVSALKPTIQSSLAQVGALDDPVVKAKARTIAGEAVRTYDPSYGVKLSTHVGSQLRQLTRVARQARQPVKIPERQQLDLFKLHQAEQVFIDDHGREPDVLELADKTGLSVKRIEKIRSSAYATPTEGAIGDAGYTEEPSYDVDATEIVHNESDYIDRKILEHKTGFGGAQVLSNGEIAAKFGLTPVQLSRRSMRLTKRINEITSNLEKI